MRSVLALVALTGCTQIFGLSDPVRGAIDAPAESPDDSALDAAPFSDCSADGPNLLACWDFEGDLVDRSTNATPVTASNITFVAGKRGQAVYVGLTSTASLPAVDLFNVASVTIEAWIRPDSLPVSGARAGIFDSDVRYGIFLHTDGSISLRSLNSPAGGVTAGVWTHVAATDDGVQRQFFINGSLVLTAPSTAVPTATTVSEIGGNAPSGERFISAIDLLRVYSGIRTATQIRAAAGT